MSAAPQECQRGEKPGDHSAHGSRLGHGIRPLHCETPGIELGHVAIRKIRDVKSPCAIGILADELAQRIAAGRHRGRTSAVRGPCACQLPRSIQGIRRGLVQVHIGIRAAVIDVDQEAGVAVAGGIPERDTGLIQQDGQASRRAGQMRVQIAVPRRVTAGTGDIQRHRDVGNGAERGRDHQTARNAGGRGIVDLIAGIQSLSHDNHGRLTPCQPRAQNDRCRRPEWDPSKGIHSKRETHWGSGIMGREACANRMDWED